MKKILLTLLFIAAVAAPYAKAQDDDARLPQAGDWAVSVSAVPILTYVGQLFNGAAANTLADFSAQGYLGGDVGSADFQKIAPTASIAGKYMIKDNFGLRANIGWLYSYRTNNFFVQDDAAAMASPMSQKQLTDVRVDQTNGVSFMFGVEYRVGKRKVQGVFGGGILYAARTENHKYMYGNRITEFNQTPSMSNGGGVNMAANVPNLIPVYTSMRYTDLYTAGRDRYAGPVAYAGIEWFFTPKMSIGGEVNVAAVYAWTQGKYFTAEGYNKLSGKVETWTELTAPKSSGFDFGTGNIGANINLTFYF